MKKVLFSLLFVLMMVQNVFASQPVDYFMVCQTTMYGKPDILISKTYCQGNTKLRTDLEIVSPFITNGLKSTAITITRLDKKVSWSLDIVQKICHELPFTEPNPKADTFTSLKDRLKLTKIGEEKVLNYDCNVYASSDANPTKFWFSKDYDLLLKTDMGTVPNKMTTEVIELQFERQDDSLFEIPKDYKFIPLQVTSQEELDNLHPVTLADIDRLLFEDMIQSHLMASSKTSSRVLSDDEINILRDSIRSGSDLKEITTKEEIKVITNNNNFVFILELSRNQKCVFCYDNASGYVYVDKYQVFHKEREAHQFDSKWFKKYSEGAYKFKPSPEFLKLLK